MEKVNFNFRLILAVIAGILAVLALAGIGLDPIIALAVAVLLLAVIAAT